MVNALTDYQKVINGFDHESLNEYSENGDDEMGEGNISFEDSFMSRRGEQMIVDEEP